MSAGWRLGLYSVFLLHHVVTILHLKTLDFSSFTHPKILDIRDFSEKYFTGWNFAFQIVFLIVSIMCDAGEVQPQLADRFWGKKRGLKKLGVVRDFLFTAIVFPFTIFTCALFWVIYIYDRELALPRACDEVIHPLLNHAMHTHVLVLLAVELALRPARRAPHKKSAVISISTIILTYFAVFIWTYISTGRWIYGLFEILSWTQRILSFFGMAVAVFVLYYISCHTNDLVIKIHSSKRSKKRESTEHGHESDVTREAAEEDILDNSIDEEYDQIMSSKHEKCLQPTKDVVKKFL